MSDANVWQRLVLGSLTACSAGVIPFTIVALGRSIASVLLLAPLLTFGAINAYSFHNGYAVLVEAPLRDAHDLRFVAPIEADYQAAKERVDQAQARLDQFPAVRDRDCLCPKTRAEDRAAWEAQRTPLAEALGTAKTERDALEQKRDKIRDGFSPPAPDWLVWALGIAVDAAIALRIFALEMTRSVVAKRVASARDEATVLTVADEAMAQAITQASSNIGLRAQAQLLRDQAAALRAAAA